MIKKETARGNKMMDLSNGRSHSKKEMLIRQIQAELESQLGDLKVAAQESRQEVDLIKQAILMLRFLPRFELGPQDLVCPASLVELAWEDSRKTTWVLLVPSQGGWVTEHEGAPVQVLTPRSPLGEALLGRKRGERVSVESRSGVRFCQIVGLS